MKEALQLIRLEFLWIVLEVAAMVLFAVTCAIRFRRLRVARAAEASKHLAPVICINRGLIESSGRPRPAFSFARRKRAARAVSSVG